MESNACSTVDKVPNVEGPLKQHTGRPLLLGADVEEKSKAIIISIRESGGTCSLAGDFLPAQVIYGGKTPACLPKTAFPPTWQITYTPNHWANEQTMMDYVHGILLPFVQEKRRTLSLPPEYPALVIFDQFKGQLTDAFLKLLDLNNIVIVQVPANCTDRLQPLDLSVNKAIKDCLRSKFQWWYTQNVSEQLKKKRQMSSPLISGCQS